MIQTVSIRKVLARKAFVREACLGLALLAAGPAPAQAPPVPNAAPPARTWSSEPHAKPDGSKWRLGYYEGGQYKDYEPILKATVRGLIAIGWVKPMDFPPSGSGAEALWRWLSANAVSDYVAFPADGYYAAGDFDKAKRPAVRAELIDRLNTRRDLDLVIAMGTWAGQDLATDAIRTPVVVASTSDPVGAKIIRSDTDSGHDHLTAKVEPHRYARQVELFHDIFHFRKLGLVYEDSVEGRTFAAVDDILQVAQDRGFEIVSCFAPFNDVSKREAEAKVTACYEEVAARSEAVYVTTHRGVDPITLPKILDALSAHGVPSFSMAGEAEVRAGALMSIAQADFIYVGRFHAETIAQILNGAKPRDLPQVWQAPAKIALNILTAEKIGYNPSVDILLASDDIVGGDLTPRSP